MFNGIKKALKDGAKEGTQNEIQEDIVPALLIGGGCFAIGVLTGCHIENSKWMKILVMEALKK